MKFKMYWLLPIMLVAMASGCQNSCAKGDTGPMGPSGSNGSNGQNAYPMASTYLYNNNFDSASGVSEWVGYVNAGGSVSAALVTTLFLSPPKCLGINLGGSPGSNVAMQLNYSGSGNLIFDSYQNFSGFTVNNEQGEYTFFFGGKRHMTLGAIYNSGNISLYTYNGTSQTTIDPSVNVGTWHHMTEVWHQSADTADYYVDGNLLAQGYAAGLLTWNTSSYPYEIAFYVPAAATGGQIWYADDLSIGQ
jgi:hypothetical protein